MRFSQLAIQTQRTAPAELRTQGLALLYRANYFTRASEALPLANLAIQRLQRAASGFHAAAIQEFFTRLGLKPLKDQETTEYFVPLESGADDLLCCPGCGYAARREWARVDRQPFSTEAALPLEKVLTPECNTITQLAAFMQLPQEKTAKALMFTRLADGKFVFVVVRGDLQLSEAKLRASVGALRLATADEISAAGAVAGYASPIGLHTALVLADNLVAVSPNLVAGANQHGYHLKNTNYGRDYPADLLADVTLANPGEPCPACHTPLEARSAALIYADGHILFEKLLIVLAEYFHDEKGLTLPAPAAPFDIYLMNVPGKTLDTRQAAEDLYAALSEAGLSVLLDDRDERAGVKFNDADIIGCPVRITLGERSWQNEVVELKLRTQAENQLVPAAELVQKIRAIL